jgi:hypothetical protein
MDDMTIYEGDVEAAEQLGWLEGTFVLNGPDGNSPAWGFYKGDLYLRLTPDGWALGALNKLITTLQGELLDCIELADRIGMVPLLVRQIKDELDRATG